MATRCLQLISNLADISQHMEVRNGVGWGNDRNGAQAKCEDCGSDLPLQVLSSAAGSYVGTACECGPYSRESDYYPSHEDAKKALDSGEFSRQ